MKKILTLALAGAMSLSILMAIPSFAESAKQTQTAESNAVIYLVPGSYTDSETKETHYNSVQAKKLSDEECKAISTPNAYLCELTPGEALPQAETARENYTFNGWWGIQDATVTYFTEVPEVKETMFLYADFRASLSQPSDPIIPSEGENVKPLHYLSVERGSTGETLIYPLLVSGTDVPNAEQAGYGAPVQFFNEWFNLQPGDIMRVYIGRMYGDETLLAPQMKNNKRGVTLESSGPNVTGNYIGCLADNAEGYVNGQSAYGSMSAGDVRFGYKAEVEHNFRIYIKFYDAGGWMTVYMENMDK